MSCKDLCILRGYWRDYCIPFYDPLLNLTIEEIKPPPQLPLPTGRPHHTLPGSPHPAPIEGWLAFSPCGSLAWDGIRLSPGLYP